MIARAVLKRGNAKSGHSVQQNLPKLGPPTVISQSCTARQQVSWSLARAAKRRSGSSLDQATGCPPSQPHRTNRFTVSLLVGRVRQIVAGDLGCLPVIIAGTRARRFLAVRSVKGTIRRDYSLQKMKMEMF